MSKCCEHKIRNRHFYRLWIFFLQKKKKQEGWKSRKDRTRKEFSIFSLAVFYYIKMISGRTKEEWKFIPLPLQGKKNTHTEGWRDKGCTQEISQFSFHNGKTCVKNKKIYNHQLLSLLLLTTTPTVHCSYQQMKKAECTEVTNETPDVWFIVWLHSNLKQAELNTVRLLIILCCTLNRTTVPRLTTTGTTHVQLEVFKTS